MDNYQAVYDAVRSRFSGDFGSAVREAAERAFDISHHVHLVANEMMLAAEMASRPSVLFKPAIYLDGDKWCALYGDDLQAGVSGFGDSPEDAMRDFDAAWRSTKATDAIRARKAAP